MPSPFAVRLDNVSAAVWGGTNILAVRADASYGSEHWYGGGGITRAVTLVRAPPQSFVENGVFVQAELAAGGDFTLASAEWQDNAGSGAPTSVRFEVWSATGVLVASNTTSLAAIPPNGTAIAGPIQLRFAPGSLQLWSTASATLYTATATLVNASGAAVDVVNISVGFRRTAWDGATGFYLNGKNFKQRGFSHHNSFAGVGVAMPQRLDLLRVQVGRGRGSHVDALMCPSSACFSLQCARTLGSNIWRMSHNPYRTGLYDLLDTLGTVSLRVVSQYTILAPPVR